MIRVYYYNPFITQKVIKLRIDGKLPYHSLYGLNYFDTDIKTVIHRQKTSYRKGFINRFLQNITVLFKILIACRNYDIVYVTNARGIKLLALFRALKIFPKPVCMLMHWGVVVPENKYKRIFSKLYISGFDHLFFFSRELYDSSMKTGWIKSGSDIHWGVDLAFYSDICRTDKTYFLSTGTEKRDFETLVQAFNRTGQSLKIYVTEKYKTTFDNLSYNKSLINTVFLKEKVNLNEIAAAAKCIVIPLLPFAKNKIYPLGLTSLVEAMALSKPVIITDNIYNGIDVEKIGCGIKVHYGDIDAWINAVNFIAGNKEFAVEMGKKGREFIEKRYNLEIFGTELSVKFKEILL